MAKRRSWITKPPLLPILSLHHLQLNLDKQITAPILQWKSHRNVRKYEASWQAVTDISLTKLPMFRNCICNRLSSKPLNGITVSCLSWLEVLGVAFGSCSIALDKKSAPGTWSSPDCQKKRLMDQARKMLLYFSKFLRAGTVTGESVWYVIMMLLYHNIFLWFGVPKLGAYTCNVCLQCFRF